MLLLKRRYRSTNGQFQKVKQFINSPFHIHLKLVVMHYHMRDSIFRDNVKSFVVPMHILIKLPITRNILHQIRNNRILQQRLHLPRNSIHILTPTLKTLGIKLKIPYLAIGRHIIPPRIILIFLTLQLKTQHDIIKRIPKQMHHPLPIRLVIPNHIRLNPIQYPIPQTTPPVKIHRRLRKHGFARQAKTHTKRFRQNETRGERAVVVPVRTAFGSRYGRQRGVTLPQFRTVIRRHAGL
mmetsp:Transcript_30147/g.36845  ORF Transcript_30147/g.36845 Transcript_30147/m.36845 type:complete len:238 (+) Transcript_30147:1098-1811(+)